MTTLSPRHSKNWATARRWTHDQAHAALAALASSGEPVSAFAARHGLDAQRLYTWRRRLNGSAPAATAAAFVEVIPEPLGQGHRGFEVLLTTGDVVRVPPRFETDDLARLLAVVRGPGRC
jgi:hypothetical protein